MKNSGSYKNKKAKPMEILNAVLLGLGLILKLIEILLELLSQLACASSSFPALGASYIYCNSIFCKWNFSQDFL